MATTKSYDHENQTLAGGDAVGSSLRLASYSANNLNQITSRDYPCTNDVIGAALREHPKGDPGRVKLARQLRTGTTLTLRWIAQRLNRGSWTHVSNLLREKS